MSDFEFMSKCPSCKQDRVQYGYERVEITELLISGGTIDAQCILCGVHWQLSTAERDNLARSLIGHRSSAGS